MIESALPTGVNIPNYVLFQNIDNEYVLLNTQTELYFGLDSVAASFWQLFAEGLTIPAAVDKVMAEYDVDKDTLENDLNVLLQALENNQLLTLQR
jgi:hypothetical protein